MSWRIVVMVFVVFMITKDVIYAPVPYGLRTVAQGLCLLFGGLWMLQSTSETIVSRYWPVLAYLLVIVLTAPASDHPGFVLLQAGSLASAVLFFIAYFEKSEVEFNARSRVWLVRVIVVSYAVVVLASLALAKLQPHLAYESLFAGNFVGHEIRFKGVFGKAGGMGQAAGLLLGFSAVAIRANWVKLPLMAAAVACLALTQSRSFWIASLVAAGATVWLYFPAWRKKGAMLFLCGAGVLGAYYALSGHIETEWFKRAARVNTLETLTGRTHLWAQAVEGIGDSPWIGFGFTLGSTGMPENRALARQPDVDPTQLSRVTLHNGYIQSLMDTGVIGTFFYIATMLVAVCRTIRNDRQRRHPEILFALSFLSISNLGESVIYSGSMFPSLCFWAFAVGAMSMRPAAVAAVGMYADPSRLQRISASTALPNLLR